MHLFDATMEKTSDKYELIENLLDMTQSEYYVYKVLDYTSRYNYSNSYYYSPSNLVGKYEKYPAYGDFPEAYCLRSYGKWWKKSEGYQWNYSLQDFDPLGAEDYITLEFDGAVVPRDICIYEIYNPGAVVRIWGKLSSKSELQWILLWEGLPQSTPHHSRIFHPQIKLINRLINVVRLEFNQSHLEYHCSIDAVLLGGYQPKSNLLFNIMQKDLVDHFQIDNAAIEYSGPEENCTEGDCGDSISCLPYEVIIHIFQYLDLKSLSRCAQVNKRWNEASADSFLYQNLSLKFYWYLVNCDTLQYFMKKCKTLKKLDLSWCGNDIDGFDQQLAIYLGANSNSLTHLSLGNCKYINYEIMMELSCCRELVDLRLKNTNSCFDHRYPSLHFLNKLVALDLTASDIQDDDLINILKANPHLKHVIIDLCENLSRLDQVVETLVDHNREITTWSSWKTLSLTADGVRRFGQCPTIRELDLGWCMISKDPGNCLSFIAEGCPQLKRLILSEWRGLNDHLLLPVVRSCKELTQLDFMGIKNISGDICEKALLLLPKLRLLDISFCDSIRHDEVDIWRQQYPHITIQRSCEYVANDYLN
ncbi:unnamed protein product [Phaedon cochleariae]|uniref:F-box domain-containing protein n=1 Tax=Phaedon cochleariae TaxID=80249 RepID=A0A9P0D836_PHACE|nr:unnamed protein product [Phaedon cochleariae]